MKPITTRNENSVDKSLEEALRQIDMLKEDMNDLCHDIDSLYNIKSNHSDHSIEYYKLKNYEDEFLSSTNQLQNVELNDELNFSFSNESCHNCDTKSETSDYFENFKKSNETLNKCNCVYASCISLESQHNKENFKKKKFKKIKNSKQQLNQKFSHSQRASHSSSISSLIQDNDSDFESTKRPNNQLNYKIYYINNYYPCLGNFKKKNSFTYCGLSRGENWRKNK